MILSGKNREPLKAPVSISYTNSQGKNSVLLLKVDNFVLNGNICLISGWQSAPMSLSLEVDGQPLAFDVFNTSIRADVNKFLDDRPDAKHGFEAGRKCQVCKELILVVTNPKDGAFVKIPLDVAQSQKTLPNSTSIRQSTPKEGKCEIGGNIACVLENAICWPEEATGNAVIVSGWLAAPDDMVMRVKIDGLNVDIGPLAYFTRADIAASYDLFINHSRSGNGFIFAVNSPCSDGKKIAFSLEKNGKTLCSSEIEIRRICGIRAFYREIFNIAINSSELAPIYGQVYEPVLKRIQRYRSSAILKARHVYWEHGSSSPNPQVSVIVPLYGNLEMLARQIECLNKEEGFRNLAELILVADDPALFDPLKVSISSMNTAAGARFIGWNGSQGFAGACNLGASIARGKYLLFLNSDVFPDNPGWLKRFIAFFDENPHAGIAGCRLVYGNGKLQHCGCRLEKDAIHNLWLCMHPFAGEDPDIDPAQAVEEYRAVTGACMWMRRQDFEAAGGLCADYLIGGFEDIDLCFHMRMQLGKKIVYLPTITMTHLEHQSLAALGREAWLDRLALYNAVVFNNKWRKALQDGSG